MKYEVCQLAYEKIMYGEKIFFLPYFYKRFMEWIDEEEDIDFKMLHHHQEQSDGRIKVWI